MNLKDILNPKTCEECKFYYKDDVSYDYAGCKFGVWSYCGDSTNNIYAEFDKPDMIHKDCPLPRIKCENCKWHLAWGCYENPNRVACIEFEEVE